MTQHLDTNMNLSIDNYNSIIFLGLSVLSLFSLNCFSYKFQKDFSNINKPSKIITCLLACLIFIFISIFILTLSNIYYLKTNIGTFNNSENTSLSKKYFSNQKINNENNINKTNDEYSNLASNIVTLILSIVNLIFYIIIPLIFFYLHEEKNQNENVYYNNNRNIDEADYVNLDNRGINSVNYQNNDFDIMQMFKNFSFYLTAYISLNIIYLILFKTSIFNPTNVLESYTFLSDAMKIYSSFNSDFEILTYVNFLVIILISKILLVIYLPYGFGKLSASFIDNLRKSRELKVEYNNLNNNYSKNYQTIKQLTTQKLMTGKNLSKKEKNILKQCKETQTLLEHKQEVLEEKYSKFKIILFYISLPFKFLMIVSSILFSLILLISKIFVFYGNLNYSKCGIYCGYFTDKILSYIGLQDIFGNILTNYNENFLLKKEIIVVLGITIFYIYLITCLILSLNNLGIFNFSKILEIIKLKLIWVKTTDVRSDKILSFIFYFIFFIMALSGINQILNLTPSVSYFMGNFSKCGMDLIQSEECKFSYYMLYNMKNSVNFTLGSIISLFFDGLIIAFTGFFVFYLPIKSTIRFFNKEESEENEKIEY